MMTILPTPHTFLCQLFNSKYNYNFLGEKEFYLNLQKFSIKQYPRLHVEQNIPHNKLLKINKIINELIDRL